MFLGIGLPITAFGTKGGVADSPDLGSGALRLLGNEPQGLAIDFTDMSMVVRDTGTPANNFSGDPNDKLTYTSPSTKWIENSAGLLVSGTTIRTHYSNSVAQGVWFEEPRTWLALHNRDFTNAVWTKSNMTAAKTAVGSDGVANASSTLTATAANATVLQSITSGSAARITCCRIRRRTGSGAVEMTQDNGTTWSPVTVTANYTRVNIAAATLANPTVGLRIVTSGDAVDVDFFGHEVGSTVSTDIEVAGVAVTRAADNIEILTSAFPFSASQATFYARATRRSVSGTTRLLAYNNDGNFGAGNGLVLSYSSSVASMGGNATAASRTSSPSYAVDTFYKLAGVANTSGTIQRVTTQGLAPSGNTTLDWTGVNSSRLSIGSLNSNGTQYLNGIISQIMVLPRVMSDAELQTVTS
jgi:hypothetical protein